jgi:cell division transport system permease protein
MVKKMKTSLVIRRNKRLKRRWITFVRMCRYGVNNFSRNAWLTVAATAVMTITLLIIFTTLAARSVLLSTVDDLRQKVDVSIYLKEDISPATVEKLTDKLEKLDEVSRVSFISTDEARESYIKANNPSSDQLDTLGELKTSPFPATLRVVPKNLNNMGTIEKLVARDKAFQDELDPVHKPSFAGQRRESIATIGQAVFVAERAGLIASAIFISISVLIIFNTIRMAIYNRKEEIEMMKLIGAEKSFIQGPFVVEAIMYGFFAALLAFVLGIIGLISLQPKLKSYGIAVQSTYDFVLTASPFIVLGLIVIGALIGIVSSFFAVRRHLKI